MTAATQARTSRALVEAAQKVLNRSERGQDVLRQVRALLGSDEVAGLDSNGWDALAILVDETRAGNRSWLNS